VGAEGGVLKGVPVAKTLPTVELKGGLPEEQLGPGLPLRVVAVLAGAPEALRPKLGKGTQEAGRGLVVQLRDGPDLIFGNTSDLAAKWIAAARVLADSASRGASYVDLRLPDRPVAGGLPADRAAPSATEEGIAAPEAETPAPAQDPALAPQPEPVAPTQAVPDAAEPTAPVVPESPSAEQPQAVEPPAADPQP